MVWHIIWMIILGLIVGWIARFITPGEHKMGWIATAVGPAPFLGGGVHRGAASCARAAGI